MRLLKIEPPVPTSELPMMAPGTLNAGMMIPSYAS